MHGDTIAAVSTPPGEGGIAVVRVSGTHAREVALKAFRRKRNSFGFRPVPWRVYYGTIVDDRDETIDECLFTYFRGPHSFTGEDLVEFGIHGGSFVAGRVLERLLGCGARLAEPGEFTRRAFLNGRLNLSQAEAVIDVIRASSDIALRNAHRHLEGALGKEVSEARRILLGVLARIEAQLDFPDQDIPDITQSEVSEGIGRAATVLERLTSTIRFGRVAREGMRVVLVGRPNVGKSSLLNALAGYERAIVTEIAGTTRDTVDVQVNLSGVLVTLIDTAGLRDSMDPVERLGIKRTEQAMTQADLILVVLDGSEELRTDDKELLTHTADKERLVLLTKADLPQKAAVPEGIMPLRVSVMSGEGLVDLRLRLTEIARKAVGLENSLLITNIRHTRALVEAVEQLSSASETLNSGWDLEMVAVDVRRAYERLGEITGETIPPDIANAIFAEFCIGK